MEIEEIDNSDVKKAFRRFKEQEDYKGDENGRVDILGERFNIMGSEYFMSDILETLSELYGAGSGGILRNTGDGYGKDIVEMLDRPDFGEFLGFLAALGYSLPRVEDESIVFPSSPTAVAHAKEEDYDEKNVCYFLAGMLTGAAQELVDNEIEFREESCRAEGAEECVFTWS